jgi:hypothetical protein
VWKSPAGTSTRPPPSPWHAATARRNASVQSATPSPTAPKSVTWNVRPGKFGGLMRRRIAGTSSHGSLSHRSLPDAAAGAAGAAAVANGAIANGLSATSFKTSRRAAVMVHLPFS